MATEQTISKNDFYIIRDFIHKISGIYLEYNKEYFIRQRLEPVLLKLGIDSFTQLAVQISNNVVFSDKELFISAITTNETSFFRDSHPFHSFYNYLMPKMLVRLRHRMQNREQMIRIWCAGSSTGQEPYSIAILIDEYLSANMLNHIYRNCFKIYATDLDCEIVKRCKAGIFNTIEVSRGLSSHRLRKYFVQNKNDFQIIPEIRNMVLCESHSLLDMKFYKNQISKYDLVLLRNVLIYFDEQTRQKVIRLIHSVLKDDSYFLLGSTENLYGNSELFTSVNVGNTILYRKTAIE